MNFTTVLILSLAAGVVLVVGGGLVMYMANLVRSAYELKVEINREVDERLNKMAEDLDKKSRWIKRDLLEEIEKIKIALQSDSARKIAEMGEPVEKRLTDFEALLRNERAEWSKAVETDRQAIAALEAKLKGVRREPPKKEDAAPAVDAAAIAAVVAAPAPPPAAAPGKPQAVGGFLPDLAAKN